MAQEKFRQINLLPKCNGAAYLMGAGAAGRLIMRVYLIFFFVFVVSMDSAQGQVDFEVRDRLNAPQVIFVPGVLGSRLLNSNGDLVWGDLTESDPKLYYDGLESLDSEPLDSVSVFGITLRQHTYGTYLDTQLRNLATAENFHPFSYDWRASTRKSSQEFAKFICEEVERSRPIIIVAHSMGGLIVERWLMNDFDTGCMGEKIDIQRLVFVATPHLGAPKAFSSLILGMDLFGFSAVDAVISRGLNNYGLSFDSTYELLPFTSSYSVSSGIKKRCFQVGGSSAAIHRVLFKASDSAFYDTLDIFSVDVLQRLGVVSRVEKMLKRVGRKDVEATDYLEAKLLSARNAICELSDFRLPDELSGKAIYFYGNLRTDEQVSSTTISRIVISDAPLASAQSSEPPVELDDSQDPRKKYYIYKNFGPGDGTVPTSIAADPMKLGRDVPRFGNSSHIGVLSNSGFRELAGALLSQDYSEEAILQFNKFEWDGISFSTPTSALVAQAIEQPENNAWNFVGGLPDLDQVVIDGSINLDALRQAHPGTSLKDPLSSGEGEINLFGTVWDASAWDYILLNNDENLAPEDIFSYAAKFPTAENWYLAGSIRGIQEAKALEALIYAGGEFLARDDLNQAKYIYSKVNSRLESSAGLDGVDSNALLKLKAGSAWVDLHAGAQYPYLREGNPILNISVDYSAAATFDADIETTLRAIEELNFLALDNPAIKIDDASIKDTLRDDL